MDKGLIVRIIVSALTWINTACAASGIQMISVGEESLYLIVSLAVTFVAFLWTGWKNNNFTKAAKEAQETLKYLKVEEILDKVYVDNRMDEEDIAALEADDEKEEIIE